MTIPSETFQQRKERVLLFIAAYRSKVAKIQSYDKLSEYLDHSTILMIPPYDQELGFMGRRADHPPSPPLSPTTTSEAKSYFHYLVGIVLGTRTVPQTPEGTYNEAGIDVPLDWVRIAFDQLSDMILAITPDVDYTQDIYAMPDWMKKLDAVEKRLASLESSIDTRDVEIRDILSIIRTWLATYSGVLEDARTYFSSRPPPSPNTQGGRH